MEHYWIINIRFQELPDIDMLKIIKNSYAMANAPEIVKRSAANVTLEDNEHEGLLQILKEKFNQ